MALSAAERQKRHRKKLQIAEVVVTRLPIPGKLHNTLKRQAARAGIPFHKFLVRRLKGDR